MVQKWYKNGGKNGAKKLAQKSAFVSGASFVRAQGLISSLLLASPALNMEYKTIMMMIIVLEYDDDDDKGITKT